MKIKSYGDKINANSHDTELSKEVFNCIWLSVILIDSVFKMSKNYYPNTF